MFLKGYILQTLFSIHRYYMKKMEIKICPQVFKEYSLQKTSLVEDIQLLWQSAWTPWSHSLIMEEETCHK